MDLKPVIREIPADLETPVSAFLKLRGRGARFLLESAEQAETLGRHSFIGIDCLKSLKVLPATVLVDERGRQDVIELDGRNPLEIVREHLSPLQMASANALPGLVGGAVGYVAYDFARFLERLPSRLPDPLGLPLASFFVTSALVVFDHIKRKMLLVSVAPDAQERIDEIREVLRRPLVFDPGPPPKRRAAFASELSQPDFERAVGRAKEYIRQGDIFQVVLSRRESGEVQVDPFQAYRALRILNPSPYMFFLDFGDYQLVGSSPEVHVKLAGREALVRPIAGTRRRGATDEEDRALERELLGDEKERAEHTMLVDLARNDLGRCCEYGTVRCADLFTIERYSHVMHIVSQVGGRLAAGRDQYDLLSLTFPAGTVTGAPKIRAMEIIEELEPSRRGPYAGTVGYFSLSGDLDMCITIRTILFKDRKAHLHAGAGIVADSNPTAEWNETASKMAALRQAVEMAEEGL
ncbi:MAG: anthranilate synthase component I [Planctomycetes bacterium]|nr:anthranilate synthase component I [Planctomycetota bacterium]